MRGNEFERKVQEQLDELHLRPSPTVWTEVEKELKKKKRRRIVFLLSMLAGIGLLGYSGYTLLTPGNTTLAHHENGTGTPTKNNNNNNNTTTIGSSLPGQNNNTSTNNTTAAGTHDKKLQMSGHPVNQSVTPPVNLPVREPADLSGDKIQDGALYQPVKTSPDANESKLVVRKNSPSIGTRKPVTQNKEYPSLNQQETHQPVASVTPVTDQPLKNIENTDVVYSDIVKDNKKIDPQDTTVSNLLKQDSAIAKIDLDKAPEEKNEKFDLSIGKKKTGKQPEIRLGLEVSGGKNFSRTNTFKVPTKNIARVYFSEPIRYFYDSVETQALNQGGSAGPQYGNSAYGPLLGNGYVRVPSPVKAGPSFKVGVNAEIKLTKRSSIVAGLRYAYQSEFIYVGKVGYGSSILINRMVQSGSPYMDYNYAVGNSTANLSRGQEIYNGQYFYGPRETEYTNKYHFLEIPLSYQWKVIDGKKIQLLYTGGVFASVLVSTNALVYDTAAYGVYYKDNKAFNNVHFAFTSGLSVRFGKENKLQWSIGPDISMDMTHVLKNDFILRKRYFMYGGVTARIFLPRKK